MQPSKKYKKPVTRYLRNCILINIHMRKRLMNALTKMNLPWIRITGTMWHKKTKKSTKSRIQIKQLNKG